MMLYVVIITTGIFQSSLGFNIDGRESSRNVFVLNSKDNLTSNGSYAGYSLSARVDGNMLRILAGAPHQQMKEKVNGALIECKALVNASIRATDWLTNSSCDIIVNSLSLEVGEQQRQESDGLGATLVHEVENHYTYCAPGRRKQCGAGEVYLPGACYSGNIRENNPLASGWGERRCFQSYLDVVFLIDSSKSVKFDDFRTMKSILVNVSEDFRESIGYTTQIGILQYGQLNFADGLDYASNNPKFYKNPTRLGDCSDIACLKDSIQYNMIHLNASNTFTATAIKRAVYIDFPRSRNYNVSEKIIVLITDGDASDSWLLDDSFALTEERNITVYAIGVGSQIILGQLRTSANGGTSDERVLTASDYTVLSEQLQNLTRRISQLSAEGSSESEVTLENAEIGFSGHYSELTGELFLGAVGAYHWTGTVVKYKSAGEKSAKVPDNEDLMKIFGSDSENSYFGYAISSGYYEGNDILYVAASAPRYLFRGTVVVYESTDGEDTFINHTLIHPYVDNTTSNPQMPPSHRQLGSYFGATLLSTDINGDGKDDLLIGAPLYSDRENADVGKVFVYVTNASSSSISKWADPIFQPHVLSGSKVKGGRFGMALTSAGDLNHDGYNDVVVSAPYENSDRGAVYVYHGGAGGMKDTFVQKISAADWEGSKLHHFGFSIQGNIDVDENGFQDLVVGSPKNDTVVVYRTRPIVSLNASLSFSISAIDIFNCFNIPNRGCFEISACFMADGISVEDFVGISYSITVDENLGRVKFRKQENVSSSGYSTESGTFRSVKGNNSCVSYQLYVKRNVQDFSSDVLATMTYELSEQHLAKPISSMTKPGIDHRAEKSIGFELNCGEDRICEHDLRIESGVTLPSAVVARNNETDIDLSGGGRVLVVAAETTNQPIRIKANLSNSGEHAYEVTVSVSYPSLLSWTEIEKITSSNPDQVCILDTRQETKVNGIKTKTLNYRFDKYIDNILPNRNWCYFEVTFSFQHLQNSGEIATLRFSLNANTTQTDFDQETNVTDNYADHVIPVKYRADTRVFRQSLEQTVTLKYTEENKTISSVDEIGAGIADIRIQYEVDGLGYARIPRSEMTLSYPSFLTPIQPLLYLYKIECSSIQGSAICSCDASQTNLFNLSTEGSNLTGHSISAPANPLPLQESLYDCSLTNASAELCSTLHCDITNLDASDSIVITAFFRIWTQTFNLNSSEVLLKSGFSFSTRKSFLIIDREGRNSTMKYLQADTKVKLYTEPIEQEVQDLVPIIVAAAVGGVVLLVVAVIILYKCGFFQSKYSVDMQKSVAWNHPNREDTRTEGSFEKVEEQ